MSNTWNIVEIDGRLYVDKLRGEHPRMLIVLHDGDYNTVRADSPPDHLYHALYDLYQTEDGIEEGDVFMYKGDIIADCVGVHVVRRPAGWGVVQS